MIRLGSRGLALLLLAGWTALIWWLMIRARVPAGERQWWVHWGRNLAHAPLFGVHAALAALALRPGAVPGPSTDRARRPEQRAYLAAAAVALAYGLLVEWRQAQVPGRVASAWDVLTDAVGALGVPWALSTGALFSRRALAVFAAAAAMAAGATWM
ncbi:MAG TPA: VanZ family protein [Planctomycetota bacterium]|nr:VanZ family protein [Planctomycetota bacterium]